MNATQAEFVLSGGAATQNAKIRDYLEAHPGQEIPMTQLWAISGAFAVHSRIADLRKAGLNIQNRTERKDGATHSFYTLIP